MPMPRAVARANKRLLNPVVLLVARRLPGFAIVEHRGRRTGTTYRTPVLLFRNGGTIVIALTYGPKADWVRNVLASEGATIHDRTGIVRAGQPVVLRDDPAGIRLPALVRTILSRARVHDFLRLTVRGQSS